MNHKGANRKAIALLSGGLDSTLALKVVIDQGIEVEALSFVTPFCTCSRGGDGCAATRAAEEAGVPCKRVAVTDELFEVIKNPKHGYGSQMNPCLDCRILMFSKARERMEETGSDFVFTGEVLGQRPMSQHRRAMRIIERESGLEGRLLRPLSARLLESTQPEKEGLVERDRLLAIHGRSRRPQMTLARDYDITDYPCPAGGCRLTDPGFARRMRDLVRFRPGFDLNDVLLLRVGRHFRISSRARAVTGRNEGENQAIMTRAREGDVLLVVPGCGSPVTLLRGQAGEEEIHLAAALTARYSDADGGRVSVQYGRECGALLESISVWPLGEEALAGLRL